MDEGRDCDSADPEAFHAKYDAALAAMRSQRVAVAVALCLEVFGGYLMYTAADSLKRTQAPFIISYVVGSMCLVATSLYQFILVPRRYMTALRVVAENADHTSLERLLGAIGFRSPSARKIAREGIVRVMSGLDDTAASTVNRQTREALFTLLKRDDPELVLAVLNALPTFEDSSPMKSVTWLADGQGAARNRSELQALARELLPGLHAIAEAKRHQEHLLRSSTRPDYTAETALRPAVGMNDDGHETLLRAGTGDGA